VESRGAANAAVGRYYSSTRKLPARCRRGRRCAGGELPSRNAHMYIRFAVCSPSRRRERERERERERNRRASRLTVSHRARPSETERLIDRSIDRSSSRDSARSRRRSRVANGWITRHGFTTWRTSENRRNVCARERVTE